MNSDQNKSLTSFLPAQAGAQPAANATVPAGAWDEQLAGEVLREISPDQAKSGHLPTKGKDRMCRANRRMPLNRRPTVVSAPTKY
jgi:hypothetical protein